MSASGDSLDFVAIDVETANSARSSICQIGIVSCSRGTIVAEWSTLVDPRCAFLPMNVSVHGITGSAVRGAPTLPKLAARIRASLDGRVVVGHSSFDRSAIAKSFELHGEAQPDCLWLDSARVARQAWPDLGERGYGLASVCHHLGIHFKHHDALEDARASAHIMHAACSEHGVGIEDWMTRVGVDRDTRPNPTGGVARHRHPESPTRPGTAEGPLAGQIIVFTGELSMTRTEAADIASRLGSAVAGNVTKKTTILVVGGANPARLADHEKTTKHRTADARNAKGASIRIIDEAAFLKLVVGTMQRA